MPTGIIVAVYAAVFAVMRIAVLFAQLIGQLIGALVVLTIRRPKAMAVVYAGVGAVALAIHYGPSLYYTAKRETLNVVTGAGIGQGSNSQICKKARGTESIQVLLDPAQKAKAREALEQQCWRLPADDVAAVCPADLFDTESKPACVKLAEECHRASMELIAGLRTSATSTLDCLRNIAIHRRIALRAQLDASREQSPEGHWVRLSASEDATIISRVSSLFGGVSPMVRQEDRMRAGDPQYLRFQWARQFGDQQLAAAMTVSHPRSHFLITHRMEGLDKSDPRSTAALFVLGKDGAAKIIIPIGQAGQKYQRFIARLTSGGRDRDVQLEAIPSAQNIFVAADASFERLVVYGDQPSDGTKLYQLDATPRLADRAKFFEVIAASVRR